MKKIDYTNAAETAVERLNEIANYEGSETGETWRLLASLWESYQDCLSPDFIAALEKEIISEAERSHLEYKLVEKQDQFTHKYTSLEFIG